MKKEKIGFLELPFIGRKKEFAILESKFGDALEYNGNCLLILGEPGIGKSRLINEFLRIQDKNSLNINVRINPDFSHQKEVFVDIIKSYLNKSAHITRTITRVVTKEIYNEFAEVIPELKTYYPYEPKMKSSEQVSINIKEIFYQFIVNLSTLAPIILCIEDIHESSTDLRNMLKYLLQNIEKLPILCVFTSRPSGEITKMCRDTRLKKIEKIQLNALNEKDILELNGSLFDNNLKEAFFIWLSSQTKGVPLFLLEFLYTLFEKGIIFFDTKDHKWKVIKSYPLIAIPETITETVKSRLSTFTDNELQFLKFAALIGEEFDPSFEIFRIRKDVLNTFVRSGLIMEINGKAKFVHPLIRDVIYNNIEKNERKNLHYFLAEYYSKKGNEQEAARHFLLTDVKDNKAVNLFIKVSKHFRKNGNVPQALIYAEKAIDILKNTQKKQNKLMVDLLYDYSKDLLRVGRYQEVIEFSNLLIGFTKQKKNLLSKIQMGKVYANATNAFLRMGQYDEVIKTANRGIKLIKGLKSHQDVMIELETNKAFSYKYQWLEDKSLKLAMNIKNHLTSSSNPFHRYRVLNLLGSIYNAMGNYERAIHFRKEAHNVVLNTQNESLISSAKGNLGISYINSGDFEQGESLILQHQEYSIRTCRLREEALSYLNFGCCYFYQGYLDKAEDEFKKGIKKCMQFQIKAELVWLYRFYGVLSIFKNEYKQAHRLLDLGIELAEELNIKKSLFDLLIHKGIVLYLGKKRSALEMVIRQIHRTFSQDVRNQGEYLIIKGFYSLLDKKGKYGLKEIDQGIRLLENRGAYIDLCRFLYFCAQQLQKYQFADSKVKKYLKQAHEIAMKYKMNGWLAQFQPRKDQITDQLLKLYCLGRLRVEVTKKSRIFVSDWKWAKPRQLLSIFITSLLKNEELNREKIGALLWPDLAHSKITNNFHVCLSHLKKVIGKEHIVYNKGRYKLNNCWIDAVEFKKLYTDAETLLNHGKIHTAEIMLNRSLTLYKSSFIEDSYDPWVDEPRNELTAIYRRVLFMLGEINLKKMNFDDGIEIGKNILILDPFDEEGHRFLMRCYLTGGEKAKAIKQYKKCKELFKRELNCLPSIQTQRFYHEIIKR